MAHHEHDSHGHDTEGNRQYYPQGWHLPLVGLVVIALAFALLAGWILNISGSDKWGKHDDHAVVHGHGDAHGHDNHDGHGHSQPAEEKKTEGQHTDSVAVKPAADSAHTDSVKTEEKH